VWSLSHWKNLGLLPRSKHNPSNQRHFRIGSIFEIEEFPMNCPVCEKEMRWVDTGPRNEWKRDGWFQCSDCMTYFCMDKWGSFEEMENGRQFMDPDPNNLVRFLKLKAFT